MGKKLLFFFLIIPFLAKAQNWKPMGPDDFNQPSAGGVETASISNSTDHVYIASVYNNENIQIKKFVSGKWQTVSDAAFSENYTQYAKIVFNGSTPYVAYGDGNNNNKLTVKKYNGTNWELVGAAGLSGDYLQAVDLAFDGTTPYVAYTDGDNNRKVIVKQYNGTNWVAVGSSDVSDVYADKLSITLNGATPYVVYNDGSNSGKTTVKKYDGNAWVTLGDIGTTNVDIYGFAVNSGIPYVMYGGWYNGNKLAVQKFNGTSWAPVATDVFTSEITGAKITFEGTTPYVIYKSADYMDPKAVVKKLKADASGWETVGDLGLLQGGSMGGGPGAQDPMAISFINAVPFAFYLDDEKAVVKQFNGTDWLNLGGSAISAGSASVLSLASDGVFPFLAYQDGANGNKATVKRYNGTVWETIGSEGFSAGNVSSKITLSLDATSTPYLAYGDGAMGGRLTVQRYNGLSWEMVGSSSVSSEYADDNMIAFNGNTPYVVYKDGNQSRLNVKKFNSATNDWEIVGTPNFSETFPGYPSIAFNEGVPYVAYLEGGTIHKIRVKKLIGNTWEVVGNTDFTTTQSYDSQIVFDNGKAYIIYRDGGNGNKVTVRVHNATTNKWELVGSVISVGVASFPKLTFVNHTPYVAYADNKNSGKLTVKKFDGNSWKTVGNPNVSSGSAGYVGITNAGGKLITAYIGSGKAYAKSYLLYVPPVAANPTVYVTETGAGTQDGSSWANATADLQQAIQKSTQNVYVASGTYKPIYPADTDFSGAYTPDEGNQDNAFVLRKDIKIYGGFSATAPETNPSLRDTSANSLNKSILSGDFNGDDVALELLSGTDMDNSGMLENAYHVVLASGNVGNAQLNNFTVSGGFATELNEPAYITIDGRKIYKRTGGGMVCHQSSPTLSNLTFIHNVGFSGAGILNFEASPKISNTKIIGNIGYMGGGVYNQFANPTLTNVQITGNFGQSGAGIYGEQSSPVLTNVTIAGNSTGSEISGMENNDGYAVIRNSIIDAISNNESYPNISYSIVQGSGGSGSNWKPTAGTDKGNNLDTDPMFMQPSTSQAPFANGDYTLQNGSPAINAGSNSFYAAGQTPDLNSIKQDLAGKPRFTGAIDMGAYEYQGTLPVSLTSFTAKAETAGARLKWQTASEQDNKSFIISRSTDGVNFSALANVATKGNSDGPANYTFLDVTPANGINYYRLEQKDRNGKTTNLGVRAVEFQLANITELLVYPNPTLDLAKAKFKPGQFSRATLLDVSGKIVSQQVIGATDTECTFNLSRLNAGTYIILLNGKQGIASKKLNKL